MNFEAFMLCKNCEWQMASIQCNIIYRVSLYSEKQNFGTPCTKNFFCHQTVPYHHRGKVYFFQRQIQTETGGKLKFSPGNGQIDHYLAFKGLMVKKI